MMMLLAQPPEIQAESQTLDFEEQTQNLSAVRRDLRTKLPADVSNECVRLARDSRYGAIPHRLINETMFESGHFVWFAAAYPQGQPPTILLDTNQNGVLECDEQVALIQHPRHEHILFRTVQLAWKDDGPDRNQRYRVNLPKNLDSEAPKYSIDLVDVPIASWTKAGHTALWVLYDGNFDGVFGGKFGDGVLIDMTGTRQFDLSPNGPNFHSFHEPIKLPWGSFKIVDVERSGSLVSLDAVSDETLERVYREGDVVPELECRSVGEDPIRFGGETGRYQILFFWVSNCGSCFADAVDLVRVAKGHGSDRVSVVGISMDEDQEKSREFVRRIGANWPHCFSGRLLWDNALARQFGTDTPSDFVIIDPLGRIAFRSNGMNALEGFLDEMIFALESQQEDVPTSSAEHHRPQ